MQIIFLLTAAFFFISCTDFERDNPDDPDSPNYIGYRYSSSSLNLSSPIPMSSSAVPISSSSAPLSSSSSKPSSSSLTIVYGPSVPYEGETYETVVIGTQTWFQRNLNYYVEGSKCGNGSSLSDANTTTCDTYGRLYDWSTAMALPDCGYGTSCASQIGAKHRGICPSGWHIPSDAEWDVLMTAVGGSSIAGRKLKAKSGWYDCGPSGSGNSYVCEDAYGFSALPGGGGGSDGSFLGVGDVGSWWSSSEVNSIYAYYRYMYYNYEYADWDYDDKSILFSVRCLQD